MTEQKLDTARKPSGFDEFWDSFSSNLKNFAFQRWYLFTIGPYLILLILDVAYQLIYYGKVYQSRILEISDLPHWIILTTVIALSVTAIAYNRLNPLIPEALQGLFNKKRFYLEGHERDIKQEFYQFLEKYLVRLRSNRRLILIFSLMLTTLVLTLVPTFQKIVSYSKSDPVRSTAISIANILAPLLWTYFAATGAWLLFVTGEFLREFAENFILIVQPGHPDKCGGLRLLGDLCLGLALPILIGTFFLGIFGIGGVVEGFTTYSIFGIEIVFDKVPPITIAANIGLILFALPLLYFAFLAPLGAIHNQMAIQRRNYEDEFTSFTEENTNLEKRMRALLATGDVQNIKDAKEELEIRQILIPKSSDYPIWPFDLAVILGYLIPQVIPILSLFFSLSSTVANAIVSFINIVTGILF